MTVTKSRVVVTGIGAITPFGIGVPRFWDALLKGQSAIQETNRSEWRKWTPAAAQIPEFDPLDHLSKKQVKNTDRFTQLALIAAAEAVSDAGLPEDWPPPHRMGISVGTAYGGVNTLGEGAGDLAINSVKRMSPRLLSKSIPNAAASALAMQHKIQGPVMTYTTACAASANAIGEAMYWLERGEVDLVLAGGAEYLFSPVVLSGLRSAGAIATSGPDDKSAWSRPFDLNRNGMVAGEGSAIMVLESYERALARGAKIYGELTGYGASNDAYHETAPHPNGEGAAIAINRALETAGLAAKDIDYINAHATATPAGDKAESIALQEVFGDLLTDIPVNSIKGAIGHLLGSAGAIESISCLMSLQTGLIPPTLHCPDPDPIAPANLVLNQAVRHEMTNVLTNSFGFGGQNGALIWRRVV
ncbi:3-oxoacyl-[acyl-carrier-protein] synthase II [Scopulibacillus darangshiensis]|uniref:3-oxoacyl-[acyl-carrier-protein] synthase II n=1 Tax=Scopulibacillus darangshiensis TaxID=442528 RepID=A0A4R2P6Y3_9BACL|nr:beta-ketoacyl-[acyl-carrier-protein] synthase family protein [Scopulibacillus darangshiensis]TCP29924.1 3-oxoacyl-[acyl-carrier-protein] synthase II [Scopulibacillus darangshiensis]